MVTQARKPRPGKAPNGQQRPFPTMSHTIHIDPAKPEKPQPAPPLPPPPGAPAPGATNPLTHPAHPAIQSQLGTQTAPAAGGGLGPQAQPVAGGNPSGNPLGNLTPTPTQDMRQVREQIAFKDMNPVEQAQTSEQQGLDPYAPLKMVQQGVVGALQAGPSTGPLPNMLAGPYVPPGIEAFPDDFAHLSTLMQQGYAPGASGQEHEFAQNANALARAKITAAMQNAHAGGVGIEQAQPYAKPNTPDNEPTNVSFAPGVPEEAAQQPTGAPPAGPQMPTQPSPGPMSGLPGAPPQGPPPGGMPPLAGSPPPPPGPPGAPPMASGLGSPPPIPPALIAALLAKHKGAGRLGPTKNKQSNQNVQADSTAGGSGTSSAY